MTGAAAVQEVKDRRAARPRSLQTRSNAQHDLLARDAAVKAAMKSPLRHVCGHEDGRHPGFPARSPQ
jgi:hypothetical protein